MSAACATCILMGTGHKVIAMGESIPDFHVAILAIRCVCVRVNTTSDALYFLTRFPFAHFLVLPFLKGRTLLLRHVQTRQCVMVTSGLVDSNGTHKKKERENPNMQRRD
jgi:hypothetical protein